ncbi:poly(3-hydroxybutyrate) depolymerase [Breoghania corrubedonensis]|uniref:Poly(3-hydroxybutyrate) depolymerase n=1 Tax=Breoghania corrubedonensis TaxID=665038 RepID=A0A2T5VH86_9HYPH|nr:polyhydroxyalkanoate depolymerase [Breoghania corrubedonensis]PTW63108.1 poly(3-hydroxybutyrate) depolymerase [Breoghania corrubedonensis]
MNLHDFMQVPYYQLYEMNHAALSPMRAAVDVTRLYFKNPLNPAAHTPVGRNIAAGCELFERITRRYGKPGFGFEFTRVGGLKVPVHEEIVWQRPFCRMIRFQRALEKPRNDPKLLIVAPMSGHYATLLRGTVEAFLPTHDVYVTDWIDARQVPLSEGLFDLDDYIDYVISMLHRLGGDTHVMAVCQPAVPVLAAVCVMEADGDPYAPNTMTLMGGPIDTRESPTAVNDLAVANGIDWFKRNVIMQVPFPLPGFMREVYPGFLQLSGFMSMNLDRHMIAHHEFFNHLVTGDGDNAEKHREFYDEYMAVMDLTAEFYLQTVETVFIDHALPKGEMMHRDRPVDPAAVRNTALLTIEGEKDDISGIGQTRAAHTLCCNIPDDRRAHYMQEGVGHYGVFNGSRFRSEIAPRIADFIRSNRTPDRNVSASSPARVAVSAAASGRSGVVPAPRPAAPRAAKPVAARLQAVPAGLAAITLSAPEGAPDDLKRISGIGPKLAMALNGAGIYHFRQIASLSEAQLVELDEKLTLRGRAERDDWVAQAKALT